MTPSDQDSVLLVASSVLPALVASQPVTAARAGLLGLLDTMLEVTDRAEHRAALARAATPLLSALEVDDVREVSAELVRLTGRPRRAVSRALCSRELVDAAVAALCDLGLGQHAPHLRVWVHLDPADLHLSAVEPDQAALRRELVDALLRRATELRKAAESSGVSLTPDQVPLIDGRTLAATASTWQLPQITGEIRPAPVGSAARYPNRIGRLCAALAVQRMRAALANAAVPDDDVLDPIFLMCAVAESVSARDTPENRQLASQGRLPVYVAEADPAPECLTVEHAWAVLDGWGSATRRLATASPAAWKLSAQAADAVVWALCSAAVRLAVASEFDVPRTRQRGQVSDWNSHRMTKLGIWESGAHHCWLLMQSGRSQNRTAWPGCLIPQPEDPLTRPWQREIDPWEHAQPDDAPVVP